MIAEFCQKHISTSRFSWISKLEIIYSVEQYGLLSTIQKTLAECKVYTVLTSTSTIPVHVIQINEFIHYKAQKHLHLHYGEGDIESLIKWQFIFVKFEYWISTRLKKKYARQIMTANLKGDLSKINLELQRILYKEKSNISMIIFISVGKYNGLLHYYLHIK